MLIPSKILLKKKLLKQHVYDKNIKKERLPKYLLFIIKTSILFHVTMPFRIRLSFVIKTSFNFF